MALSKTNNKLALNGKLEAFPNVDRTLSVDGWCAEAKTTGERFNKVEKEIADAYEAMSSISGVDPTVVTHTTNKNNPHAVTAEQIGLGNVDNTSDMDKPVSTAQAEAIAEAKQTGTDAMATAESAVQIAQEASAKADGISIEGIGAAPASHEHSAENITSGTLPLNHGGTGATSAADARANLGIGYTIYKSLTEIGLSGKVTMNQVCSALPQYSCLMVSNSTSGSTSISDAPCSYGFIEIIKNGIYGHARATRGGSASYEHYLGAYYGASDGSYQGFSGWTRMMPNVLTAYEHGTALPTSGFTKGRIFFKKVSG